MSIQNTPKWVVLLTLLLLSGTGWAAAPLDMLADLTESVTTEFAVYQPMPLDVVPSVTPSNIAGDFSNVVDFDSFGFTPEQVDLLRQNGFVAIPGSYKEMYDAYNAAKEANRPVYVTVDALLHAYHELFDYCLRTLESEVFLGDLENLTDAFLTGSRVQYQQATEPAVQDAARANLAYFAVAKRILKPTDSIPAEVVSLVTQELELIDAHAGLAASPIFGYQEDYSQYVPRGHYTLSSDLERYFLAMMWYGRMTFHAEPVVFLGVSPEMAQEATRRALLIAKLAEEIQTADSEPAIQVWERIYHPTAFFVGKAEDLSLYQYSSLAETVYGSALALLSVDALADATDIQTFLTEVTQLPPPAIVPEWGKGFRLMGQRFIPDSYMFTELVYNRTSRLFPKGLDVMAVLGSERAYEILDQVYQETDDAAYVSQMAKMKTEFEAMDDAVWAQNLYWNWLYCFMPLLAPKGAGFPSYMQGTAWQDKELSSALGSWAELRHDTILYAKQSYTCSAVFYGYQACCVEPNPWAFARLASLTQMTIDGLQRLGLLEDAFSQRLQDLHSLLVSLEGLAEKQLTNTPLTIREMRLLHTIGETLVRLTIFESPLGPIGDELDDDMAVIADVHTDIAVTNECLEEGVGRPLDLYVLVPAGPGSDLYAVAAGSAFAYYEFTWPMNDRLTDEKWQEMLSGETPPEQPEWTTSYIAPPDSGEPAYFENAPNHGTSLYGHFSVTIDPATPCVGQSVTIRVDHPYSTPMTLYIEIICEDKCESIQLLPDESTPEPQDLICTFDTTGWTPGETTVTLYCPENLKLYFESEFTFQPAASASGPIWRAY